jgi:predicted adenylyl cyclase CyaB
MARNVELKVRLVDPETMLLRIQSFVAAPPHKLVQTDTFFNVAIGRMKLREFDDGSGELICYERPDAVGPKVSEYVRVPTPDPVALRQVLTRSIGVRATVRKRRRVFLVGQTRIHLDDVEGLGSFMEFEIVLREGQSVAEGNQIVAELMNVLAVSPRDLIPEAYVDLLESATSARTASRSDNP